MAKAPSMAAQAGVLVQKFELPEVFGTPEPIKPRFIAPYITFAHNKRADEFKRIIAANGNNIPDEMTMWLIRPDRVDKLDPAKLSLIHYKQYWCLKDAAGNMTATLFKEMPRPWNEHIEAVCLVYFDGKVFPVNVQFRTTKCPALVTMSNALHECQTEAWAARSPAHKDTLAVPTPSFRFYANVTVSDPKTPRGGGNLYRVTQADVKPTGPEEWTQLKAFTEDPEVQKIMNDAGKRYQDQLASFEKLLQK